MERTLGFEADFITRLGGVLLAVVVQVSAGAAK
jgi:hypothetical protein